MLFLLCLLACFVLPQDPAGDDTNKHSTSLTDSAEPE